MTITIDEEIPLVDIKVKTMGKINWLNIGKVWKSYKFMTGSIKNEKIEIVTKNGLSKHIGPKILNDVVYV